jgi:hypothetical protein
MGLNIDDQVLMGMGIESVQVQEGNFEILTPGAHVTLQADGALSVRQRIGTKRKLLSCRLPSHLAPWRLAILRYVQQRAVRHI